MAKFLQYSTMQESITCSQNCSAIECSSGCPANTTSKTASLTKLTRLEHIFSREETLDYKSVGFLKSNLTVLMGIPTVKRPTKVAYIYETLKSLFRGLDGHNDTGLLVFVGQGDENYFEELSAKLKDLHPTEMEQGRLKVVCFAPYDVFYPDYLKNGRGREENLTIHWKETMEHTLWRVRQAVDYIYLWSIVRTEAEYFLQLEDDVTLKSNFMSIIKNDIQKEKRDKNWFALGYSPQGLLCKLIRTRRMVPLILKARSIFHVLPIDHIYWQLAWERNCLGGQTSDADCRKAREVFEKRKQNLVDHKGTMSSSGKFRKNR